MIRLEGLMYIIVGIVALLVSIITVPVLRLSHRFLYKRYPNTRIIKWIDDDLMDELDDQFYLCIYTIGIGIYQLITNKDKSL